MNIDSVQFRTVQSSNNPDFVNPFSPTSSPAPEVARLAGLPALRPGARSGDAATHDSLAELQPTHRGGLGGCLGETCRPERIAMDGRGDEEEVNLCGQQKKYIYIQ